MFSALLVMNHYQSLSACCLTLRFVLSLKILMITSKSISMESMQLPYGVNMALAKDDIRSRSRLVVTYKCKQSRGLPIVITICSYLAQTHHNSVHSIQINEVVGKLWCVHLLHLMTFTTSLHLLLTSSLARPY